MVAACYSGNGNESPVIDENEEELYKIKTIKKIPFVYLLDCHGKYMQNLTEMVCCIKPKNIISILKTKL